MVHPPSHPDVSVGRAANQIKNSSNLKKKVNENSWPQKNKEKKENLIAGAVPLVAGRSVTLAEARCAIVREQEQAGRVGEGWNSQGKGVSWALASGVRAPGSQQNPLPHTLYCLKTPHTNEYIRKPTSKGNMLCNAYANCDLFLCSCGRQTGTASACNSCFHHCSYNIT